MLMVCHDNMANIVRPDYTQIEHTVLAIVKYLLIQNKHQLQRVCAFSPLCLPVIIQKRHIWPLNYALDQSESSLPIIPNLSQIRPSPVRSKPTSLLSQCTPLCADRGATLRPTAAVQPPSQVKRRGWVYTAVSALWIQGKLH